MSILGQSRMGQDFLAMERLEGETLADRLKDGRLSSLEGCLSFPSSLPTLWTKRIAAASSTATLSQQIFFSTVHGMAKILDFGLARTAQRDFGVEGSDFSGH